MLKVFNINQNIWLINTNVKYTYNTEILICKLNINIFYSTYIAFPYGR